MNQPNKRIEEIVIPARIGVFTDKKSKAKSIALPFTFPDGTHGAVILTRLSPLPWVPHETAVKVDIHFPPNA